MSSLYNERIKALESALGLMDDTVLHAVIPFQFAYDLGGRADVYQFKHHLNGVVFVTGDLLGSEQPKNAKGSYELMICHRTESDWGPKVISSLAYCTIKSPLNPGESMDLGPIAGSASEIVAFVFDRYCDLDFQDERASLLLCLGITKAELVYKSEHDGNRLLALVEEQGVYPQTDLNRTSILLG